MAFWRVSKKDRNKDKKNKTDALNNRVSEH